jgi:Domain of unknown function (DUF3859)
MRRSLMQTCVLLLSANAALAEDPLMITEVGIFCPYARKGSMVAPDTLMGTVDLIDDHPVDVHDTTVPAQLTLAFGIRYRVTDGVPDQTATISVTHPHMGTTRVTRQSWDMTLIAGDNGLSTYRFDLPEELVLGHWTMQVDVQGQTVFAQDFTVVPPAQAPMAIDVCFGGLTS